MMYIPISFGTLILGIKDLFLLNKETIVLYLISFICSFIASYFSLKWFVNKVTTNNLKYFALYLFLLRDQPGFNRTLYKVEFEKITGYKKTAYYTALQELKDKGYLVHINGPHWNFYPEGFSGNADSN